MTSQIACARQPGQAWSLYTKTNPWFESQAFLCICLCLAVTVTQLEQKLSPRLADNKDKTSEWTLVDNMVLGTVCKLSAEIQLQHKTLTSVWCLGNRSAFWSFFLLGGLYDSSTKANNDTSLGLGQAGSQFFCVFGQSEFLIYNMYIFFTFLVVVDSLTHLCVVQQVVDDC